MNCNDSYLTRQLLNSNAEIAKQLVLQNPRYRDPKRLNSFETQVFSQTGADGIVAEIFHRVKPQHQTFLEIGTEDGTECNTAFWLMNGWSGVWIDGNTEMLQRAAATYETYMKSKRLKIVNSLVTAENIKTLTDEAFPNGDIDLLSIDIDRNTYWVWKSLQLKPRVVVIEYNATIPPTIDWKVEYDSQKAWNGTNYFGAGLFSYEQLGREKGYQLVGCDLAGLNAFFVRSDLCGDQFPDPPTSVNVYEPLRPFLASRFCHPASIQG